MMMMMMMITRAQNEFSYNRRMLAAGYKQGLCFNRMSLF